MNRDWSRTESSVGNGVFVAVSPAGTLLTSTDGLEWGL
jgi:hypothetical protein